MSLPTERCMPACHESVYGTWISGSKMRALLAVVARIGSVGVGLNDGAPRRFVSRNRTGHDSPASTSGKALADVFLVAVSVAPGLLAYTLVNRSRRSLM